jgi:Restriction endonuclease
MATKTDKTEKSDRTAKAAKATKATKPEAKADKPAKGKAEAKPASKGKAAPARPTSKARPEAKADKASDKPARGKPARGGRVTQAIPAIESEAPPAAGFVVDPAAELTGAGVEAALADDDEDALHERIVHEDELPVAEPVPMTPEEQELAALYGDELAAAPPAAAHGEFSDKRTADEDRPMMPEINGRQERQKQWQERRDERRSRRDQERSRRQDQRRGPGGPGGPGGERRDRPEFRDRGDRPAGLGERAPGGDRPGGGDRAPVVPTAPVAMVAPAPIDVEAGTGVLRVGNSLGDAAWAVFASLRGAQPMPVRQLAGMMRKRGLLDEDPERAWPHLKAALIADERSYRALGLRPRIVYRGRDLFGPGAVVQSATAAVESELARALSAMAVATHRTLKARVATANHAGFERLAHAYLVSAGFRDIAWIKQVEGISYATALPPEGNGTVMISARSGDTPVDRRGVGELRVGVEAKGLLAGFLLAPRELSAEAERELERPGRSLTMLVGDTFISALLATGVGVVTAAAPLRYVDDQLLGELLSG